MVTTTSPSGDPLFKATTFLATVLTSTLVFGDCNNVFESSKATGLEGLVISGTAYSQEFKINDDDGLLTTMAVTRRIYSRNAEGSKLKDPLAISNQDLKLLKQAGSALEEYMKPWSQDVEKILKNPDATKEEKDWANQATSQLKAYSDFAKQLKQMTDKFDLRGRADQNHKISQKEFTQIVGNYIDLRIKDSEGSSYADLLSVKGCIYQESKPQTVTLCYPPSGMRCPDPRPRLLGEKGLCSNKESFGNPETNLISSCSFKYISEDSESGSSSASGNAGAAR